MKRAEQAETKPEPVPKVNRKPTAWHIREYPAIKPSGGSVAPDGAQKRAPEGKASESKAATSASAGSSAGPAAAASAPVQTHRPTLRPRAPAKLVTWPGIAAESTPGDASDFDVKPRRNYGLWTGIFLTCCLVAAMLAAIQTERKRSKAFAESLVASVQVHEALMTSADTEEKTDREPPKAPAAPKPAVVIKDVVGTGTALCKALFSATTPAERLACVADAEHQKASVEEFFASLAKPIKLQQFRPAATEVKCLPGSNSITLCEVLSDYASCPSAITQLIPDENGTAKLDWEMLHDSLLGCLARFSKTPNSPPQWITIGLRRNFGFNELESVRNEHLVFDIQGAGDGADRTIALVSKGSPIGRALDKMVSWNDLYIARCLMHWVPVDGASRLFILDAEITPTGDSATGE